MNETINWSFDLLEEQYLLSGNIDYSLIVQNLCNQIDQYIINSHNYYIKVIIVIIIFSFLTRFFPNFKIEFKKKFLFNPLNIKIKFLRNFIMKNELYFIGGKPLYLFNRILNISHLILVVRILYVWSYMVTFGIIDLWVKLEYLIYFFYGFGFLYYIIRWGLENWKKKQF